MHNANPRWSWLLTQWDLEPSVIIGLLAVSAWYLYLCGYRLRLTTGVSRGAGRRVGTGVQLALFFTSIAALGLALLSPLDYISDEYLFSAHMIQHLVLAALFPPLFLLSLPEEIVAPIFRKPGITKICRWITFPAVAFLIFNVDVTIWHLPTLYDLTLRSESVHIFEHMTFIVAGVIVWWPVLSPIRSQRLGFGLQELYLFANLFPMMALGIFFSFWQYPLYTPYVTAPRLWGISALTDQQLGGLIMWMPGDAPFLLAMAAILVRWFDRGDPVERGRLWTGTAQEPAR